jgi:hypothetical protein
MVDFNLQYMAKWDWDIEVHWTFTLDPWQTGMQTENSQYDIQDVRTVIIVVCNNMYLSHGKLMQHWKSQI